MIYDHSNCYVTCAIFYMICIFENISKKIIVPKLTLTKSCRCIFKYCPIGKTTIKKKLIECMMANYKYILFF